MCVSAEMCRNDGESGGGDARDSRRVPQCYRALLRESLDDLARESGNALELERIGNPPSLVSALPLDSLRLAPEITLVLEFRLYAGEIERGIFGSEIQP